MHRSQLKEFPITNVGTICDKLSKLILDYNPKYSIRIYVSMLIINKMNKSINGGDKYPMQSSKSFM